MVSGRSGRGFTVASPADDPPEQYNLAMRRGSKSLPVTPAHSPNSSPTSRRKMNGNRYVLLTLQSIVVYTYNKGNDLLV